MKNLVEFDDLFELSNLDFLDTGLPMLIWVSVKRASHGPRIKVQRTYTNKVTAGDWFSVSVSDNPEIVAGDQGDIKNPDLQLVKNWIILNKAVLLDYWESKIMTRQMMTDLKKHSDESETN